MLANTRLVQQADEVLHLRREELDDLIMYPCPQPDLLMVAFQPGGLIL